MTSAQQATYYAQYLRWHVQQERVARRVVASRLSTIINHVAASVSRTSAEVVLNMLPSLITEADHLAMLSAIYIPIGVEAAQREYDRLLPKQKASGVPMLTKDKDVLPLRPQLPKPNNSGGITISLFSDQWRTRMRSLLGSSETASRITQMTETTRNLVREVLVEGVGKGLGADKIARSLRTKLGGAVLKTRALLIARTETTRAANAGHEAGAMSTLLLLNKVWIATLDGRTRPTHAAAGRLKPVARDGFFIVGGKNMKFPGDPAGGAAECVGCRCVVSYVPVNNLFN